MSSNFKVAFDTSGLDPSFKEHAVRGIGRYVRELDKYFTNVHDSEIDIHRFSHSDLLGSGVIDKIIDYMPAGRMTMKQQVLYPARLSSKTLCGSDLVHFPAHMDGPTWSSLPVALTVLDLIPLVLKDLYKANRPTWRFHLARWLELRAMRNAKIIFAISENTARDVHNVLGIPYERIFVTPLGVDQSFFSVQEKRQAVSEGVARAELLTKFGISHNRKILLYVGGIDPRKNILSLFEALNILKESAREKQQEAPLLIMAGQISQDKEFPRIEEKLNKLGLNKDVLMLGYVSDEALKELLALADIFVFPSLYEGFGLPVLEAMASGVPVVSAKTSSIPEVLGEDGFWFDPNDVKSAADAINNALSQFELREGKRQRSMQQALKFSWEKTGEATLAGYRAAKHILKSPLQVANG